jgi:hypothetical protein
MDLKLDRKEYRAIHEDFFQLDKENKLARVDLAFNGPSDIFAATVQAGVPIISDDFIVWLFNTFDYIPDKYKLDISVSFADMEGYSVEGLEEIFRKNIILALRMNMQKTRQRNRLARILCLSGVLLILLSVWLVNVWTKEGTNRDIVFFVLDIASTVPFWGAMEIYLVEGSERRKITENITKRFRSISFHPQGEAE